MVGVGVGVGFGQSFPAILPCTCAYWESSTIRSQYVRYTHRHGSIPLVL